MKLRSVSGLVFYVKDLKKTAEFYETLGFRIDKNEPERLSVLLNWYRMDFYPENRSGMPKHHKESSLANKGAGLFVCVNVDDVDEFYKLMTGKGYKAEGEPQDYPWGNREFLLRDPDGYKLLIFQRK